MSVGCVIRYQAAGFPTPAPPRWSKGSACEGRQWPWSVASGIVGHRQGCRRYPGSVGDETALGRRTCRRGQDGVAARGSRTTGVALRAYAVNRANAAPQARVGVLVVGPVPPPIHGAARITQLMVTRLREAGTPVTVIDTSGDGVAGSKYHAYRLLRHIAAVFAMIKRRKSHGALYIGGAGGGGLWYQAAVLLIARVLGYRLIFHHHSFAYITAPSFRMRAVTIAGGHKAIHVVLCRNMGEKLRRTYGIRATIIECSNASFLGRQHFQLSSTKDWQQRVASDWDT